MDRSFLSRTEIAVASREFVCIRLATYESAEEAEFLRGIYLPRSGDLENTTFGILSPDARVQLVRSGRGPQFAFRSAASMAKEMKEIATDFKGKAPLSDTKLPLMASVDLGLNVASCDGLPLVVTYAKSDEELQKLNASMVKLAWDKELAGQYIFAATTNRKHLKGLSGLGEGSSVVLVSPGEFGVSGKVLAEFKADAKPEDIRKQMLSVALKYPRKNKSRREHNAAGIALGLDWETKIPETDRMSLRAKERQRGGK